MYWSRLIFSILLCLSIGAQAQKVKLSPEAEIYVMTLGPYQEELYSAFGHSAIHLKDPYNKVDWVYNYGVFDFQQENFFWNFARGKMLYRLGMSRYNAFKNHYEKENRYIIEQRLNLTLEEKQALVDYLAENYKPENREYYYNYVYDNCATKIREVLNDRFPGRITFETSYMEEGKTIRDLMDDYLTYQPWGDWIIDIGLGMQIDKEADEMEYMFLPDYIQKAFEGATFKRDSVTVSLVAETVEVYKPTPETPENGVFTPFNVFVIFFFVVGFITNRDFKKEKRTKWIDPVVFTLAGLLGWWLVFLWAGTEHLSKDNLNLLWAIPLHIPLAYLTGVKKLQPFLSKYFLVIALLYGLLILLWSVLPQPLHQALIPYILTMILRGFYIHFDLRKQLKLRAN
ncbi:lipoprotein N-acyltransferase Lnb domain-containing protein [Marinoscillum furvescens]|uniref:Uncharacterized protein DUF4105 n=1 Tax=Marinoscillum furvescens DSM 4134 TaxID=1122208 RepID=A0A3D9L3J3_MARFU|nr:DUF4105 domain-containing protein [Marinoscillum furvescens]RED98850.1 uncharacterized protein DUF4105 [Marinoscillum furvescens DSM 4134]